jgi:CheY-like chemotaxis protein
MMPVMDGLQLMARLRADSELKDTPVVMMTAAPNGIPLEARVWDALLVKPFDAANLTSTVDRLVGGP